MYNPGVSFQRRIEPGDLSGVAFSDRLPQTGLFGMGDTTTDFSPSWFNIVGTLRQIAPLLDQAETNLLNASDAADVADAALDPTGENTPNADQVAALMTQLQTAIDTYDSIANALNTVSSLFPSGPIPLAGLGGILPDAIGGWTLAAVLNFISPIGALIAAAMALYQTLTATVAPGAASVNIITSSIQKTNDAVNQALIAAGQAPATIGQAAATAAQNIGKYAVIGLVIFLLGDALIHKEGLL